MATTSMVVDQSALRAAARRHHFRRHAVAYTFLLPNLIFFIAFLLFPIAWVVRQSFFQGGVLGPSEWVGLDNWEEALSDSTLTRSLRVTTIYVALAVPALLTCAVAVALLLREMTGRSAALARWLIYLPSLAPVSLAALIWVFMMQPDFGLLNLGNRMLGLAPVNWLGEGSTALPALAMLEVWRGLGFWSLFVLAGIMAIPSTLYDAAAVDGASAWKRLWHVTLPGVRGLLVTALILMTLFAMQVFDSVYILTAGGPAGATATAVLYIYRSVFESANPGYGAVLSIILLLAIFALTAILLRISRGRRR